MSHESRPAVGAATPHSSLLTHHSSLITHTHHSSLITHHSQPATASEVLDQGHDVAFGILEPRSLRSAGGRDAVLVLPRHAVLFKRHAARLQLRDFTFDVLDLPERLARLRRAGVRR